ncbi:MFS transporter [Actinoplanes friuliensis]|uniref:YfiS-like MFS-type transporter n=1 Tax=Actinoplanes friuliensis DSM 7358 TaxID=1246995 RepID=U5VPU2_9ACTN|nr:MFS transporter [Actinoplanes friuliensis]AGZ38978.1 yfiS-like MFS-type transporter [Actinoplanes friuliensis DSM 7358]
MSGKGIAALTAAKLISTTGSWTSTVAMPWFVLTTTGSPARMSLVLAAQVAGVVLLGLPGGALVTRLGTRRTMLLGDAARAPLIALIPLLFHVDALAFPVLLALAFTVGGFTAPYVAAQRLAVAELVGEEPARVTRANSLVDGATRVGNLAGPALAGVLIGVFGAANVLLVDALTFVLSFLIVLTLVHPRTRATATRARHGLRTMTADPALRWMAVSLLFVGVTYPLIMVTLPVLTTTRFAGDPRTYGLLVSASGLGLAAGSVLAVWVAGRWSPATLGGIAAVGAMGPLWLLPLPLSWVGTGAVLAVSGLFIPVFSACLTSYFTLRTRPELRARVMTGVVATENTAGFAAYACGGLLIAAVGIGPTLLIVAVAGTGCALSLLTAVREIKRDTPRARRTPEPSVSAGPGSAG